ncbi:UDP-glycosyltransferase UGT5-like [Leptidea sinapis]|uniref:UDP-glycosyltransferase UGT5-like n=1 Tax=Leptidea sinapis TaxID=189913 RepID=UPI00212992B8|nr:UDP-glycosyltransferase UGT5-like [Leptidea sinapis]
MRVLLLFLFIYCCDGYKLLLFFPLPGKSHGILGEAMVHHLVKAGHEVTYIAPYPLKKPAENVRYIDVSENINVVPVFQVFDINKLMYKEMDLQNMNIMFMIMEGFMNATLQISSVQNLMHDPNTNFDAVIVEWLFTEIGAGFSEVFGCPLIWFSSMEPHSFLLSLIDDHLSPAYTVFNWDRQYSLDFYGRVKHLYLFLNLIFDKWKLKDIDEIIYRHAYKSAAQSRGRKLSPLHKVKYNASLMLGNSHVSSGESFTLPQSYKPIGGFHIPDEIEPLPKNLQDIMDKSTNGVIYFSLGTILQSTAIPDSVKRELLNGFSQLKETVIWKFETEISNLPNNVHVVSWAPQRSILAHPNTKLFITHGGLLSTFEVLRFGVPIIGIPMFGDQFINVNRAVRKGFAKRFDLGQEPVNVLIDHIKEILRNPSYREKAKELSVAYHDRPVSPGAELVHWVEHVVKTRGAPHLRSPALHVPFYQKLYLDLLVLLLIIFSAFLFVTIRALSLFRNNSSVIEKKIQ